MSAVARRDDPFIRAVEWPRLHRWIAALLAGIALGFLTRTGRIDRAATAAQLAALQAQIARSYDAIGAADRAAVSAPVAVAVTAPPVGGYGRSRRAP